MARTETSVAEALSRAHQALRYDLRKLEESVNPTSGQEIAAIRAHLIATQKHILQHFRFEEQNGYMDKVRKREPRLDHTIEQLAAEHRHLAQSLETIIKGAKDAPGLDQALREKIQQWVASVQHHEGREDELVQNAFNLDIGAED